MKKLIPLALAVFALARWVGVSASGAEQKPRSTARLRTFTVYDNLGYGGKPDTTPLGLLNCNIIYQGRIIWKDGNRTNLVPDEAAFKALVRDKARKPGPIVIDIEGVPLSGERKQVAKHLRLFLDLVKWAHEAVPGCVVGYYGHGLFPEKPGKEYAAEAKQLAAAVDAFFPSMYTFNDSRDAWTKKLESLVEEAHRIAPGKPVYPYVWPQYHEGTPKALQFISGDYWSFQLNTARECGADGVVFWSSSKVRWPDNAEWWQATLRFMAEKQGK
jgi:hypothetical protein